MKSNVDGAYKGEGLIAGCEGVIRDETGAWVLGFNSLLGSCNALMAELWGTIRGLKVA